jgi:hypothetical protein
MQGFRLSITNYLQRFRCPLVSDRASLNPWTTVQVGRFWKIVVPGRQ